MKYKQSHSELDTARCRSIVYTHQFAYAIRPGRYFFPTDVVTCIAFGCRQSCGGGQKLRIGTERKAGNEKRGRTHDATVKTERGNLEIERDLCHVQVLFPL